MSSVSAKDTLLSMTVPENWFVTKPINLDDQLPAEKKRQEILEYFQKTWTVYEALYDCLASDDIFYVKAINLRHPLVFYFNHTAAFYINKLFLGKFIKERVDPELEYRVAVGVDEMSWDDVNDTHIDWPTMDKSREFRNKCRKVIEDVILNSELKIPIQWDSAFWVIMMGIEHERIHLETSSVLIRQHKLDRVCRVPSWNRICPDRDTPAPVNELVSVKEVTVPLGKSHYSPNVYGWDNEYGDRTEFVPAFRASKYVVSNQEYYAFYKAGAYTTQRWWSEEGWRWVTEMKIKHPEFWVPTSTPGEYKYRTMLDVIDMPWSWPIDCNYLEAKAFCNWRSENTGHQTRLPTEQEWYSMVLQARVPDVTEWTKAPGNTNIEYWCTSCPVNKFKQGDFYDLIGNVWQWTETWFDALDETFRFHPLYHDFSSPTFDRKHNVIKGGTWISTGNEAVRSSRYAFRRHFFQHAGFRYVETTASPTQTAFRLVDAETTNPFDSEQTALMQLEFNYGEDHLGVPNFPKAIANLCIAKAKEAGVTGKALDLGCGAGRSTFELATHFEHVDGVDNSNRLLWSAMDMQQLERVLWTIPVEGNISESRSANLQQLGISMESMTKINFKHADGLTLPDELLNNDAVLCANVMEFVSEPKEFLGSLYKCVRPGGILLLASAYQWSEKYSHESRWVGGYVGNDTNKVATLDELRVLLSAHFEEIGEPVDVPFVVRVNKRKFEYSISQATAWKRKEQ